MKELDITTLRLFVAVCEMRSIARAAEQANIVGSAISKRLAQMEQTVGTALLTRRRHGVEPTAAGESLLEHARSILASADRITRDIAAYAHGVQGQVRILATASVMAESLADDVAAFLQAPAHQAIEVSIEERISPDVIKGIRDGIASIGICWDAADLTGLQSTNYRTDHLAIVVHPSHPLALNETVSLEQSLDYEHVNMPGASALHIMLHRAAALSGKTLKHRISVSNHESALRVVRANLAIAVIPLEVAQPFAGNHELRVFPLKEFWAKRNFVICFRDKNSLSGAAEMLMDYLAKRPSANG
jgi:DNA-binding transcriptional LysR family regulator